MPLYGRLEPFQGDGSAWPVYEEQPGPVDVNGALSLQQPEPPRRRETLGQFVAALRGLASGCAFGEQLDSLLRDRFVCGINDPAMQTRLLELPGPLAGHAVKAALAMEAAAKDASELARAAGSPSTEAAVNKMATRCGKCSRCGGDHPPSKC
ncbi:hypothetical protein MRX96_038846 [Rhipicephalus microplus]